MAKSDMAKAMSDMANSYPHLVPALGVGEDGFDPTNPSVQKSMRSLLSELNDLLSTTYQLDVSGLSNKRISHVRVPRTKSDRSFWNSKEWIDTAIQISGSKHAEHLNPRTELPITSSATIMTHSSPPAKHNEYLCANR